MNGKLTNFVLVDVETGQKIDLSGGIPELTLEDIQEEPAAGAQLYASFLREPIEIILQAKIPTLLRQWRRPYVRKFRYRLVKKIARARRLAKVKERWREKAENWKTVTRIPERSRKYD